MNEERIAYRVLPDDEGNGWTCLIDNLATGDTIATVRGTTPEQAVKMAVRLDTRNTFGARIRRLRTEQGRTLRDLSRLSGVSVAYMSELESDEQANPSVSVVRKIARALSIPLSELLADEEDKS